MFDLQPILRRLTHFPIYVPDWHTPTPPTAGRCYFLNQPYIDPMHKGIWTTSKEVINKWCAKRVGTDDNDVLLCVDWEQGLDPGTTPAHFWDLTEHLRHTLAQPGRRVRIGFYTGMFHNFWDPPNKNPIALYDQWKQIWDNCDVMMPSVYLPYANKVQRSVTNLGYRIKLACDIANLSIRKPPVYPMMWHRYTNFTDAYGWASIHPKVYRTYLRGILSTQSSKIKPEGLILWEADDYHSKRAHLHNDVGDNHNRVRFALKHEMLSGEGRGAWLDRSWQNTLNLNYHAVYGHFAPKPWPTRPLT